MIFYRRIVGWVEERNPAFITTSWVSFLNQAYNGITKYALAEYIRIFMLITSVIRFMDFQIISVTSLEKIKVQLISDR